MPSLRNGHLAPRPSNIEPTQFSSRATIRHRASIFVHKEGEEGSLPPDQASGHSGAAHHQSSGVQSDGAAATTHGKQSRDTGTHGSEGMTVSAHSCRMVGALSGKHMHACMALRPSLQRRYSCTRRRNKVRARIRGGRSPPRGAGGGAPCKVKCTQALRLPPGCEAHCQVRASTLITLKHTPRHLGHHSHLPPGQPSAQQGPYILNSKATTLMLARPLG